MNKLSSEAFEQLHKNDQIRVDIFNISDPDANPAPLVVSKPQAKDLIENKFVLRLTNMSDKRLVLGGFRPIDPKPGNEGDNEGAEQSFMIQPSGLYVNFSDMVNVFHLDRISVSIDGTPVHTQLRKLPSESDIASEENDLMPAVALAPPNHYVASAKERDPSIPPFANPQHLGKEEYVLYIWPEKEKYLGIMSTLTIQFENVVSEFFPALRYMDISWELKEDFLESTVENPPKTQQGFHQLPIELARPIGFLEPPLPIQASWLNNQNCVYTSLKGEGSEATFDSAIKNELYFALSNVGVKDFVLDCSKHSRGVPYFELVMTGDTRPIYTDENKEHIPYLSSAVADIADLVNVEVTNTSGHHKWETSWEIDKKIQGPLVKWEIRPNLQELRESQELQEGTERNDITLLGTDMDATVTFKISNLVSKLPSGVALVYFRFYNMPQHDDGQLVLFLEKRSPGEKQYLVPQLREVAKGKDVNVNGIASPFYWRVEEMDTKVEKEVENADGKKEMKTVVEKGMKTVVTVGEGGESPLKMEVKGALWVNGQFLVRPDPQDKKSEKNASLELIGSSDKSPNGRGVVIKAEADHHADEKTGHIDKRRHRAAKMSFWTRSNDRDDWKGSKERMVIDGLGNVGIGKSKPDSRLDVNGKVNIEKELHAKGEAIFDSDVIVNGDINVETELTFIYNKRKEFSNEVYEIKGKKSGKEFFKTIDPAHKPVGAKNAKTNLEDFYWEFLDIKNKTNFIYKYLRDEV